MLDLLNSLISSAIDYQTILTVIAIYLLALWIMFCLWVFLDAHKRYHKLSIALLMSFLVFLFNFPALIFYLIVRPEEDVWQEFVEHEGLGGVQVPLVEFTGEDNMVRLSLSLQIHPQTNPNSDMVVDVGWDSKQAGFSVHKKELKADAKKDKETQDFKPSVLHKLQNKAKQSLQSMQQNMSDSVKQAEEQSSTKSSETEN